MKREVEFWCKVVVMAISMAVIFSILLMCVLAFNDRIGAVLALMALVAMGRAFERLAITPDSDNGE